MRKSLAWISWTAVLFLLAACAGGGPAAPAVTPEEPAPQALPTQTPTEPAPQASPTETPSDSPPPPTPDEPVAAPTAAAPTPRPTLAPGELACEVGGYACSLDEMSDEALTRSAALSVDAEARMRGGDSAFEVAAWLGTQDGVEVEITDGRAILYRVDGSVPIVVEHPGVEGSARQPSPVAPARFTPRLPAVAPAQAVPSAPRPAPGNRAQVTISEDTNVVGSQREDRNEKRALVLAPYVWQLNVYSDGPVVAEILGATRAYKDRVTFFANAAQSDQNVTVHHFMNWDQYDTIHVNTHGKTLCPEEGACASYVMTGQRIPKTELAAYVEEQGLRSIGVGIRHRGEEVELVVFGDFFRQYYGPGSLKNKIIYFSACEILARSDVLGALTTATENSDFFGWTYSTYADDALAAASALYERMAKQGQSAGDAYERIPDGVKYNRRSHAADFDPFRAYGVETDDEGQVKLIDITQTTDFQHHVLGEDTNHAREVITLLHPETKAPLEPGAVYPINGTLGDGDPERIELFFWVEGYTQPEIQNEDILISFELDGERIVAYRAFLPDTDDHIEVKQEDEFKWQVQLEEIEIPDQQPATAMVFRAELQLPGGDPSVHEVNPVMTGQRDVTAIFGQPPLRPGQSYTIAFDRDSQIARAEANIDGQQFTMYANHASGRAYFPNPQQGGYWYMDGDTGKAFTGPLIPVDWPPKRLEEAGFVHEPYPCEDEQCNRYRTRQGGGEMVLTYDKSGLLVKLEVSGPEGGGIVEYEYGPVTVAAPANALPAPVPIPFMGPSIPIPSLP